MAAPLLDHEFMEYWSKLTVAQKESLSKVVKSFVAAYKVDIDEYNKEIKDGEQRIEAGSFYTQEEVEQMAKDW